LFVCVLQFIAQLTTGLPAATGTALVGIVFVSEYFLLYGCQKKKCYNIKKENQEIQFILRIQMKTPAAIIIIIIIIII
jgi:hypothetical protein